MAEDIRWKQRFDNFNLALHQLGLAVELSRQRPLSDLEKQGLIQGFEYTHELAWNLLKDFLEHEGVQGIIGSRGAAREAFKRGLIQDGQAWMDMIESRNLSSHTYNLETARTLEKEIINTYHPCFLALQNQMQESVSDDR
ncbi:MAG: nucleotidyltransferase substrate binding protein [Sulfuricellaceae bacterium]